MTFRDRPGTSLTVVMRECLLKFAKNRKRWIQWLFEAGKRYGLDILNYTVTAEICVDSS